MRDGLSILFRTRVRDARPYLVGSPSGIQVKLNQNENPDNIPDSLRGKLQELLSTIDLNRYPSEQPNELRDVIAQYSCVSPESVLVTHGSNEFVHSLCLAFVEPGRHVLIPSPSFSLFRDSVALFGGEVIEVEADANLDFPVEQICEIAAARAPELVIIAAPNNPTGRDLSIASIEKIVSSSPGMVVVDEAYWEFSDRSSATELLDRYDNLIVMRTLSKAVGLAGLRIGYAIARPEVIAEMLKVRLPFMVPRIDAALAMEMLKSPELIRSAADRLKLAQQWLSGQLAMLPGVDIIPSKTNFVLFKTPFESTFILRRLVEAGVLVRDMSGYRRLKGYLRVNAGTNIENTTFITALKLVLSVDADEQGG